MVLSSTTGRAVERSSRDAQPQSTAGGGSSQIIAMLVAPNFDPGNLESLEVLPSLGANTLKAAANESCRLRTASNGGPKTSPTV